MSVVSSAISTNSRSNIFFTTFGGIVAAGLYGLGVLRVVAGNIGVSTGGFSDWAITAAASKSRPLAVPAGGPNTGRGGKVDTSGILLKGDGSLPTEEILG